MSTADVVDVRPNSDSTRDSTPAGFDGDTATDVSATSPVGAACGLTDNGVDAVADSGNNAVVARALISDWGARASPTLPAGAWETLIEPLVSSFVADWCCAIVDALTTPALDERRITSGFGDTATSSRAARPGTRWGASGLVAGPLAAEARDGRDASGLADEIRLFTAGEVAADPGRESVESSAPGEPGVGNPADGTDGRAEDADCVPAADDDELVEEPLESFGAAEALAAPQPVATAIPTPSENAATEIRETCVAASTADSPCFSRLP